MGERGKMLVAAALVAVSAAVLAAVRNAPVDVACAAILVASLGSLARVAIRAASDPGARGRPTR